MKDNYKVSIIVRQQSLEQFNQSFFSSDIQDAIIFSENIINSYRKIVNREIHQSCKNNFLLYQCCPVK